MREARTILSTVLAAVMVLTMAAAASGAVMPETGTLPGGISVPEGSGLEIVKTEEAGYQVLGLTAAQAADAARAGEFIRMFSCPDGIAGEMRRGDIVLRAKELVGTGDTVVFTGDGGEVARATVIVMGDIIGNGIMSIAQLVRMASVLTGNAEISGPYLQAGDFTGTGVITIGDVVQESKLLVETMQ